MTYELTHSLCKTCGDSFGQLSGLTYIAEHCWQCCVDIKSIGAAEEAREMCEDVSVSVANDWKEVY